MTKQKPNITIHYGAGVSAVEVDGRSFDMNAMTTGERTRFRKITVGALEEIGYFA